MTRRRADAGFTLLEIVIAISLASLVFVALAHVSAMVVRQQVEGLKRGTVTGWSLVGVGKMTKEIADSTVLVWPNNSTTTSDSLVACKNWSRMVTGGALDTSAGAEVEVIVYCLSGGTVLQRYLAREPVGGLACPSNPPPASFLTCPPTGATWDESGVVALRVERLGGAPLFARNNSVGGVRVRYVVGAQTPTTNDPNPTSVPFDLNIAMQKAYNNTAD